MEPFVQVAGALLVLAGFVLSQAGRLRTSSVAYLTLNAVGGGTLAVDAALTAQPGFLLLEGVWALVAVAGLVTSRRAGERIEFRIPPPLVRAAARARRRARAATARIPSARPRG